MSCPAMPDGVPPAGFDFTDPDVYATRVPLPELAALRATAPVWWNAQPHGVAGFGDDGYWVVTRHADVKEVSTRPEVFSSAANTAIIRFHEAMTREQIDVQRLIMLNMDPPEHTRVRQIVQRGFSPRAIRSLNDALRERAARIVADARRTGSGDFVTDIAVELPLQAIAELIGVPQEDRARIFDWSNKMVGYDDPELAITEEIGAQSAAELISYAMNLAAARKECPAKDIVSTLVAAADEGNLGADEFGFFVLLLAVAGNETTRNAITHGMHAFLTHPEQWELFKRTRPATTADEIVRWATPVVSFQRTATRDTELGGARIAKGQRVGVFYSSANHDPEVFDRPEVFDITRDPNPHLGFGGGGPHFCLGASLARLEIDLIFGALADTVPGIRQVGEPRRLRSSWLNGIKEMRVTYE
ncbi:MULTISPECIES: cytochrome P450 [Streptomycetaceae]|uniref:Cytochrome P450 hydroxylase n=1 Tax=Streptantibioticus cattleyicolor (strain ATCC 35852 / DSM 46488 / JCM 4925 / NBRC 14057 / NRRL 8057) TaxID=1003195 RepID=F8K394_STREN|nr:MULTISPECIES: cytochrome P450 [Streptomycetaceae]AEW93818.1 cytochrome P450 hydroxylase [Streptantibioticus cattleyicolor NRRL 8057 = DSM 46488]MYS58502.1 cytochrome P450 [Streptomyces sp. SID5468]CCB74164.1 putative cytochrome P450 125 [Streptantibioticus cattleyicolor NRRL 8057 = DSM 46488]